MVDKRNGVYNLERLSVESAPEVLRVNSNFDEGKIDQETGFAIADADEENPDQPSLQAQRNTLSGAVVGDVITTDLHEGFFGIKPDTLPTAYFEGAEVTIIKLPNIDPETKREESGEVRFHATRAESTGTQHWYVPIGYDAQAGTWRNLVPLLYSANSQIPREGVKYWIEGVKPGKITLEYRIAKGGQELMRYEQTFLVCTQQSKAQWQQEIRDQIELETGVEVAGYSASGSFLYQIKQIQQVYRFYEGSYRHNPAEMLWAGLGKRAGAPVYAGLSDAQYAIEDIERIKLLGYFWWPAYVGAATAVEALEFCQEVLIDGGHRIYSDLAWQCRAYKASGYYALKYVKDEGLDQGSIQSIDLGPWRSLMDGELDNDHSMIIDGSNRLTIREQRFIVQGAWDRIHDSIFPDAFFSFLAENPIPGGAKFAVS